MEVCIKRRTVQRDLQRPGELEQFMQAMAGLSRVDFDTLAQRSTSIAAGPCATWVGRLADHREVEILDLIDDHSRIAIAIAALPVTTGPDVVDTFVAAFAHWGTPAGVLTDNGAIFTAKQRGAGRTALEITLGELGIKHSRSRPYHPQTCGKVCEDLSTTLHRFGLTPVKV
jgi:transposase InsO family protein